MHDKMRDAVQAGWLENDSRAGRMNNPNLTQKMVPQLPLTVQGQILCVPVPWKKISSVLICSQKINGIIETRRGWNRNQTRGHHYTVVRNNHHVFVL